MLMQHIILIQKELNENKKNSQLITTPMRHAAVYW